MTSNGSPASQPSLIARLLFPAVNALVFGLLLAVVGYCVFDPWRWIVTGLGIGLGAGLLVEFGLGAIGGWIYRRRLTLAVLAELVLIATLIGPFIYVYVQTTPQQDAVCCIEASGLGDPVEDVRIPVADGETLAGWYAPPQDHSRMIGLFNAALLQ